MAHHQQTRMNARSEEYEPVFAFRMIRVSDKPRELVCKGSFGLLKRDPMFLAVSGILVWIPVEGKVAYNYIVVTL